MSELYIGIDISKSKLDVAFSQGHKPAVFSHTPEGLASLAPHLKALEPKLVVCEATGGYERELVEALEEAEIPVTVINPRQVRYFAKALGVLAKTDGLDAKVLAEFAEKLRPEPRLKVGTSETELKELMVRRDQLAKMIQDEKNRLGRARGISRLSIENIIHHLKEELKEIESITNSHISGDDQLSEKADLLRSVPGVGPIGAAALLAFLPELGLLSRQQVAALVGVAPLNHDSGNHQGRRAVWGGRRRMRTILYMLAVASLRVNPVIKEFYLRLKERGKKPKQALIACMRKLLVALNSMIKNNRTWHLKSFDS